MTLEEEERFVLLASVLDLGGAARKHEVLDNVAAKGYLKLGPADLKIMPNRNEQYWRNHIAFVRKHLVLGHYLNGARFNSWEITPQGRSYFKRLSATVVAERLFHKLTPQAVRRASE